MIRAALSAIAMTLSAAAPAFAQDDPAALSAAAAESFGPAVGETAPGFTLSDAAGEARSLEDLADARGLVLYMNRSLDWCPICLRQTLDQIHATGYAHHIQRLMLLGNFALISGIDPQQMERWFHDVFIDSTDWVMQTNVLGMGLFADGGILATKPYAASANYIHKMSDYCRDCRYNHNVKVGERACPFNFFYWDFLLRHRQTLTQLGRMGLVLSHLNRMDPDTAHQIQDQAQQWWQQQSSSALD